MHPQIEFIEYVARQFPEFKKIPSQEFENLFADQLISPFNIELEEQTIQEIQEIIRSFYELRENKAYQQHYSSQCQNKAIIDPGNKSMMMSYDFHLDQNKYPRLIEINTNAAFLGLGTLLYQHKNIPMIVDGFSFQTIQKMIEQEMQLNQSTSPSHIAIIDENPTQQRLYIEFLVFRELFKSFGWQTEIIDCFSDIDPKFNFIYNRTTDFYLEDARLQNLKKKFNSKNVCLSPHPYEYLLLADKQRLIDWSQQDFIEGFHLSDKSFKKIKQTLLKTIEINQENKEEVWNNRKTLFFKPKNAFGSKQSYKGQSISKKVYEDLLTQNCVAQDYVPAPEIILNTPEGPQNFKYDLRAYAYQDQLQLIVARIYQGQVTNLKTKYGGFACVIQSQDQSHFKGK